jgi:NADPH-dependent 7-cyano-7-deazaguanine reductase QueF
MIYKRLSDILDADDELMVAALYTRRGGIDITPVRYSKGLRSSDVDKILDLSAFARSGIKQ